MPKRTLSVEIPADMTKFEFEELADTFCDFIIEERFHADFSFGVAPMPDRELKFLENLEIELRRRSCNDSKSNNN